MKNENIIVTLLAVVLVISVVNTLNVSTLTAKFDSISLEGNVIAADDDDSGLKEVAPLPTQNQPQQPSTQPQPVARTQVSEDDDPVMGDANAPVTIIEFSDYQCPFCARFWSDTLPQIKKNYIDTGKVKLVYRDLPLSFHANAQSAAEAAECADDQGKFWEMHDKLFANYNSLSVSSYKQWASELGLNSAQFDECLDSGKYTSEVQKDLQDGSAAGISGTPSFFINGIKVVGAQPYSVFEQIIEAELNK